MSVRCSEQFGKVTPTTRFVSVSLKEPPKAESVASGRYADCPGEAFVTLFDNATNSCYETAMLLTTTELLFHCHIPHVQPTMTIDEQVECEQAVLASVSN